MRNRVLALTASGLMFFSMCALAQDASSSQSSSQTDTSTTKTKTKKSKKTSGAGATSATSGEQAGSSSVAASDKAFMMKAAQGGLAEVQLGQLAVDKAQDADVKAFGQRMVDDHGKANDQLKSIAQQKGVTLPTDLDAKDKAAKDRLSKLSGAQFDRAYMRDMVSDHKKDVAEFKKEANAGKDNDVKNFASQTVPTLESHLQDAEKAASKTGASAAKSKANKKSATSASTSNPQ